MSVGTAIRNPRGFVVGKWDTFVTVLFDPEHFYEELDPTDRLWREMAVVFIVGAAGSVGTYFMARSIMSNIYTGSVAIGSDAEYGVSGDIGTQIWGYSVRGILGAFALWIALAVGLYVTSWMYSNRGSFFGVVKRTAWATIPLFIGNLITSITFVVVSWNAWDAGRLEVQSQGQLIGTAEQTRAFFYTQLLDQPLAIAGIVVGALFVIWVGHVAAYGVADVRDIPVENARYATAPLVVLYLAYVAYRVLGFAGVL